MKKIIGYIIRLTAILLSVIFFTMIGVDAAIAAEPIPWPTSPPDDSACIESKLDDPPCNKYKKKMHFSDIDIQKYKEEVDKFQNGETTLEQFIKALNSLPSK